MARPKRPAAPSQSPNLGSRIDAWINTITGLGTSTDKLAAATVTALRDEWRNSQILETLYYEDDLIRKFVDKIVDHSLRQGITPKLQSSLDDKANAADEAGDEVKRRTEAILRRLRELDAVRILARADKLGRLHGGAAIFIGADGTKPELPLDPADVGRIRRLVVYERDELQPVKWYGDPLSARYGEVEFWRFTPMGTPVGAESVGQPTIHASRLLMFEGLEPTRQERMRQQGWSPSVVVNAIEALRDGQQNWRSIGLILNQAHQIVFKMKGLAKMISEGQDEVLRKRMSFVNLQRSIARALVIDAEGENVEYLSASLSGLDTIADKNWQRIAAAFDMPLTILMGISPGGLGSNGDGETRQWYDSVQAHRQDVLEPPATMLIQLVAHEIGDPSPTEWSASWPSLWQMSPMEEATYRKTIAETDNLYVQNQTLRAQEVAVTRFGGGSYSAEAPQIDLEVRDPGEATHDPAGAEEAYGAVGAKPGEAPQVRESAPGSSITLAPTDIAKIVTVNEARGSQGLADLKLANGSPDPDGKLTLAAFAALQEAKQAAAGATIGQAEGAAEVAEAPPNG
jgi:phage-related protein (TIGR01555 family)